MRNKRQDKRYEELRLAYFYAIADGDYIGAERMTPALVRLENINNIAESDNQTRQKVDIHKGLKTL